MQQMETEFAGQFVHVDTHVSGDLWTSGTTAELTARGSRFGVSGIPDVWFDGTSRVTGASTCAGAANTYRNRINTLISSSGGVTPIDLSVELVVSGGQATITGTAELVDNVSLPALQMTLFLVEDPVIDCCDTQGNDTYHAVTRGVRSSAVTLSFGGGTVQRQQTWTVDPDWVGGNLYAVGVVENQSATAPRTIYQAAQFRNFLSVTFDRAVASVPNGNGQVEIPGTIFNGNEAADLFDLAVSGTRAWSYDFQLAGDPTWYTNTTISLAAGESRDVTIRVTTDGAVVKSDASLTAAAQNSVFQSTGSVRIFNGSPAILVVDADNTGSYEDPFENAVPALGYLFDITVASSGQGPVFDQMNGYDLVVWETGYVASPMNADRGEALEQYLTEGGNLLLSSMGYTNSQSVTPELLALLGIDNYVSNTGADEANGVGGDPISDGTSYTLVWPSGSADKTDTVNPTASAATVFTNEVGQSNVLRNELAGGNRVVFSSIQHTAFDAGAQDVAERMITWILGAQDPSSTPGDVPFVSQVLGAAPNPFSPTTELSFALSDWAATEPVSLRIIDASGRVVSTLVEGRLEAGRHAASWNGTDTAGREVANGIYFALLKSADGESRAKLVRIR